MDKYYYSEKLNDYLLNKLSESEKSIFEQLLDKDPVLKQDCQLQQEIVEGIGQFRKDQLKARFNKIDVSDTPEFQINRWAWMSTVAASALVGSMSLYMFMNTPSSNNKVAQNKKALQENVDIKQSNESEKKTSQFKYTDKKEELVSVEENQAEQIEATQNLEKISIKKLETIPLISSKEQEIKVNQQPKTQKATHTIELASSFTRVNITKTNLTFSKILAISSSKKQESNPSWLIKDIEEPKGVFDGVEQTTLEDISNKNRLSYQSYDEELFLYNNYDQNAKTVSLDFGGEEKEYLYLGGIFYEIQPNRVERTEAIKVQSKEIIARLEAVIDDK